MGLTTYQRKRNFRESPEPRGTEARRRGPLRFVVQKHQASRLHYDFRLELDGTLKSWAVPRGPSLDPRDRRLAMMVEDHPLEYRDFEGSIPAGNYGAGTVMVWDAGTYRAIGVDSPSEQRRILRDGLREGRLRFVLEGRKLRGAFSLVRLKKGEANAWLLVKAVDEHATERDVTTEDRSVVSRQTLEGIARATAGALENPRRRAVRRVLVPHEAPPGAMPRDVRPMLATLVDEPFDRPGWIFEPKWDGYRAIAEVAARRVRLYSRNGMSFKERFAPIVRALESFGHEAVLDGEVVAVDAEGRSRFQLLQNFQKTGQGRLLYYVFDILYLDGRDLRPLPLGRRKEILTSLLDDRGPVRISEHVEQSGRALFEAARSLGLEGIIAKDSRSAYVEGRRGQDWLKIKTGLRQEAVIAGFTEPRGSRKHLGALVLGVYEGSTLVYIGHSGGGLGRKALAALRARLEPLVLPRCPFARRPGTNAPVHWVEPKLVCEIAFQEWTAAGVARHPIVVGLREDKAAREVHREIPMPAARPVRARRPAAGRRASAERTGRLVAFTNESKVYWPGDGYTKGDLIAYYRDVAPLILPYLRDRPESLHRHPGGIEAEGFFQKDVSRRPPPDWVETVEILTESSAAKQRYVVCQDEATLLYLANLGCIEMNPWNSRVGSLDRPDYLVIDLDPESIAFPRVLEAARAVHRVLDRAGVECHCKTSGRTGLHLFVPLGARYEYEQARQFAELVANIAHAALPESTSVVRAPAKRQGRVYLDFLQNRRGQTLAAPYSVRPVAGAPVSTPLRWSEVRSGLDPGRFTIRTIGKRVDRLGDLWAPVLGPGIDMEAALERLGRLPASLD